MTGAADPALALARVPADPSTRADWERLHLSAAEATLVNGRATEKRRAEFVAGRLAAKAAVALLVGPPLRRDEVRVLRGGTGATGPPRVVLACGGTNVHASISHAAGVALGAASHCAVGADVVAVEDHGLAFEADAFVPGEIEAWRSCLGAATTRLAAVAVAFGAKEAALKWMRTGLTIPLQEIAVGPEPDTLSTGHSTPVLRPDDCVASVVPVPDLRLRVAIGTARGGHLAVLQARILRLESRVALVVWGRRAPPAS